MEPLVGFEPTTCSLRMSCSTPELQRLWQILKRGSRVGTGQDSDGRRSDSKPGRRRKHKYDRIKGDQDIWFEARQPF